MNILLLGASGQVAWSCLHEANNRNVFLKALSRKDVDFGNPIDVEKAVISSSPDIVVNAVAYTAVDKAEEEQTLATRVNSESVHSIAKACKQLDIPLIHLSTDYVFDGGASTPYTETSEVSPLGVYGASKYNGEEAIRDTLSRYFILRTSWVFGIHGNNFVKTMLRLAKEHESLRIVADQVGKPTFASHIAEIIFDLISMYEERVDLPWGTYHLADNDVVSWYEFAGEIFKTASQAGAIDKVPNIEPINTCDYPTPAKRPAYSVLCCYKLEALLKRPMANWKNGLETMLQANSID